MGSRGPSSKAGKSGIKFAVGVPEAPAHLDDAAKAEYARVAALMEEAGPDYLQQVDMSFLCQYAQAWSDVLRLTPIVRQEGEALTSDKGNLYPNPRNNALQMAYNRLKVAASALGFSPSDRNRIGSKSKGSAKSDPLGEFV